MKMIRIAFLTLIISLFASSVVFASTELILEEFDLSEIDLELYRDEVRQEGNLVSVETWVYEENGAIIEVIEEIFQVEIATNNINRSAIQPRMSWQIRTYNVTDAWTGGRIATFTLSLDYITDGRSILGDSAFARTVSNTTGVNWSLGRAWFTNAINRQSVTASVSYSFRNSQGSTTSVTVSDFVVRV